MPTLTSTTIGVAMLCIHAVSPQTPVLVDGAAPRTFPRAKPAEVGLVPDAVDNLVKEAETNRSNTLFILKDGKVVVDRCFTPPCGPIHIMSVTKAVVSLAIGLLIHEKRIPSVDAPLSTWFPEWKEGAKAEVTLRHVMTHSSGLKHHNRSGVMESQPDPLKYVRELPLVDAPGTNFSYSNEAVMLLSGVILAASGKTVDIYLKEKLFEPMGIRNWSWFKDGAGNVVTNSGLSMTAHDLALLGQLMLNGGEWKGKQLLPRAWVQQSTTPALPQFHWMGLLWFLDRSPPILVQTEPTLQGLQSSGFAAVNKLSPLTNKPFDSREAYWLEAGSLLDSTERAALARLQRQGKMPFSTTPGELVGFHHDGWLGQYLVVSARHRMVVVRQHQQTHNGDDEENNRFGFGTLYKLLETLTPAPPAAP